MCVHATLSYIYRVEVQRTVRKCQHVGFDFYFLLFSCIVIFGHAMIISDLHQCQLEVGNNALFFSLQLHRVKLETIQNKV